MVLLNRAMGQVKMFSSKSSDLKSILSGDKNSIQFRILVTIAFKNLFYKKLRTTLTIVGVVVGIGAVVFLLSFGYGLRNLVTSQVVDSSSIRTIDVSQANVDVITLTSKVENDISTYNDVESVSRVFNYAGQVQVSGSKTGAVVYGTDQQYMDLSAFELAAGPNISLKDKGKAIVNTSFLKAIGTENYQKAIGSKLDLEVKIPQKDLPEGSDDKVIELNVTISSVIESGAGAEIFVPSSIFVDKGIDNASQAKILVSSKEAVSDLQKRISSLGYTTSSPLDTVESIDQVFGVLNLLFLGFGSIGLVIAVLGMFNTLTITLLERTKEIGLMRTLGARRKDIRRLFIIESMGLSFIGGLLGLATAFILSRGVNYFLNSLANSRGLGQSISVFSFKGTLLLEVLFFSALLGVVVVYFPARRAARMSPIEALRS